MRKRIAGLLVAAMVLTMSMGVFAADSVTSGDVNDSITSGDVIGSVTAEDVADAAEAVTKVEGIEGIKVEAVTVAVLADAIEEARGLVAKEDAAEVEVLGAVEVTASKGGQVTFTVTGITAKDTKDTIVILHGLADGTWEQITPDKVEEGKVVATFTSFSPVVIVRVPVKADLTGIVTVLPMVAVACVGGIAACAKKENE